MKPFLLLNEYSEPYEGHDYELVLDAFTAAKQIASKVIVARRADTEDGKPYVPLAYISQDGWSGPNLRKRRGPSRTHKPNF